jgi:putative flavoprotein involved in K+ transport
VTVNAQPGLERRDVVVVGAGQSGLAVSWYLRLFGVDHVVYERGGVGESWRSARWDSFTLVTPAWMTRLPGLVQRPGTGDTFTARDEVVALLEAYAAASPVRAGVERGDIGAP